MEEFYQFQAIKVNMLEMLKHSKEEYKLFEKTGDKIYLQQAGEKLFNAFERYLELKYQKQIWGMGDARRLSSYDSKLNDLFAHLETLHNYIYHGEVYMSAEDAKRTYVNVYERIESRIKNL